MVDNSPFTEKAYKKLCFAHFVFSLILGGLLVIAFEYSGTKRGTNKTPYFFTAGVLIGLHVICMFFALYVAVTTRSHESFGKHEESINRVLAWYNFVLNIADVWCFIGTILTFAMGCCKGKKCYAQINETENIFIAVAIGLVHFICFIWFMHLSGRVRVIDFNSHLFPRIKKPASGRVVIKRITLESDSSDSEDDQKAKQNKATSKSKTKLDGPVADAGKLPFAVLAKTMAKFMHARSQNKISSQQGSVKTDMSSKQPKKLLRRHKSSPVGRLGSRDPAPPLPPSYETVVGNDRRNQRTSEVEATPYHLPPLPEHDNGKFAGVPDNLYNGDSFPDTHIVVIQPKKGGYGHGIIGRPPSR